MVERHATIYDVAKLAGVSHQTVSRYVKGYEGIRPATKEKVERALAELEYRPNMVARSLATNRSHRIGALVYEMLEQGPSKILNGASNGAREAGYLLDIVSLDPRVPGSAESAVELLNQQSLAGILAFSPTLDVNATIAATRFTVPVYVESETQDAAEVSESLNGQGLMALVEHLYGLGHRHFFQIAGPDGWMSSHNRAHAYDLALAAHRLRSVGSAVGDWSAVSGYRAAAEIPLAETTAVVAGNDQMALGALRALRERGVRVPQDMSVVGFDDIPEAAFFEPPLTTVRLDFERQGRIAIARLLTMIGETGVGADLVPVEPELQVRASTGPVRP